MKSVRKIVRNKILKNNSSDKIWSYSDFDKYSRSAVAMALSNLHKEGLIDRASRGFYYVPKKTILGVVPPNNNVLAFSRVAKKASFSCISGLNGYNKIGLTTQIPKTVTIACNKPMRSNSNTKYILRNKPHSGTDIERIVLDAIIDIDVIPDTIPVKSLARIKEIILSGKVNINDLGISAINEPPKVKAIVGALGQELGMDLKLLSKLRSKLNPNTVVYSDVVSGLKFSSEWRIKPRVHR